MNSEVKMSIPIARTDLTEAEILSVLEPLRNGWLVQGPYVRQFEEKWSAFTGAGHSIAVTSCTTALHLSLAALGFGPGDEALVPAFTWISTANVVEHLGGKVVFCDIDLDTFNIDVDIIESLITPRTRAILPVHLFGLSADMAPILALAAKHDLWVVEDAACGFGSRYHGSHVGTLGHTGCFSFHPRKAITTGEGGMITTNDDELAEKLRRLRDHGAALSDLQRHHGPKPYLLADHPLAGYNQRMTDIQAALGLQQLRRFERMQARRKQIVDRYNATFAPHAAFLLPVTRSHVTHAHHLYVLRLRPSELTINRDRFIEELTARNIGSSVHFIPIHMHSFYRNRYGWQPDDFPVAHAAFRNMVSLPLSPAMSDQDVADVIDAVLDIRQCFARRRAAA